MNRVKLRNTADLVINILMAVLVIIAVSYFFTEEGMSGEGNMDYGKTGCFIFFTNDSNILAAVTGLLFVPFNIRAIRTGTQDIPLWAVILKFIGTAAVTVTFIVVLVFLGPTMGYGPMYEGVCLELHLICPLLSVASFCFLERSFRISKRQALWGVVPVLIYGTVYLVNVIFTGVWSDFYNFNIGGYWYISYVVMIGAAYIISIVIGALHNRNLCKMRGDI